MPHLIKADSIYNAWHNASSYVYDNGSVNNLVIDIENPCDFDNLENWIHDYNPINHNGDNIKDVINTIFPYKLYSRYPVRSELYSRYKSVYERAWSFRSWGTYFQRLISYGKHFEGNHPNQLERAITALRRNRNQKSSITFHLTDSGLDANTRPRGAPCWHYGELICHQDRSVDLVAVYRNHDYFNKALGNFIGLSKLLQFLCSESGRNPKSLIIHSIHAHYSCPVSTFENYLKV